MLIKKSQVDEIIFKAEKEKKKIVLHIISFFPLSQLVEQILQSMTFWKQNASLSVVYYSALLSDIYLVENKC